MKVWLLRISVPNFPADRTVDYLGMQQSGNTALKEIRERTFFLQAEGLQVNVEVPLESRLTDWWLRGVSHSPRLTKE